MEPEIYRKAGPSKSEVYAGLHRYLFVAGVGALLLAPFLTWFNYGLNFLFPNQVSLIWLLQEGYWISPVLYFLGVAATLAVTVAARRPVAFVGALPAAFPVFILIVTLSTYFNGSMGYTQAVTIGMFTALLGSALLESSYFACQRRLKSSASDQYGSRES